MKNGIVYIVDDDSTVRASIETMVRVMGVRSESFESAEEFLHAVSEPHHGCVITDVRMLGMSGVQLLHEMSRRQWSVPTIIVTAYADIRIAVQTIKAGASTLLEKPCRDQELWDAIVDAMAMSKAAIEATAHRRAVQQKLATLTDGELQVLRQMIEGTPNKLISKMLDISPRTVDIRRQAVLKKMSVDHAIQLARLLSQAGIEFKDAVSEVGLTITEDEPLDWQEDHRMAGSHSRAG